MNDVFKSAQADFDYSQTIRRDIHRNPELGFKEFRTSALITNELSQLGFEVKAGIAETGVVAVLEGQKPGPVMLLRFDMDALPVQEENKVDYVSTFPGIMHACGHDGHIAVGLTVARLLKKYRESLPGAVKFIFQPAEEGLGGAKAMISAGVLDKPRADYSLAIHLWNERPVGWFGITPGPIMAGSDIFDIEITGRGGHGAIPEQTIDPVVVTAHLITSIQTVISRNVSPLQGAVISIGQVIAGNTYNVIPQRAIIKGTIRTFVTDVREIVLERLGTICSGIADAYQCKIEFKTHQVTPPVINNKIVAKFIDSVTMDIFEDPKIERNYRSMVSEDMSYFLNEIPGCFIFIGSANPEKDLCNSHHSPQFDFDEAALINASALIAVATLRMDELLKL